MLEPPPLREMPRPVFATWELLTVSWQGYQASFGVLFFSHFLFNLISSAIGTLLLGTFWYGLSVQALHAARGEKVDFEQLFEGFQKFIPTLLWGIGLTVVCGGLFVIIGIPVVFIGYMLFDPSTQYLFSIAVSLGFGLAILPVLVVTVLYAPTMFFMIDQGMEIQQAMLASQHMVLGNLREWLRLWGVLALLHMAGLAMCCVGILFTTPWMAVALAEGYRREQQAVRHEPPVLTNPA